ncbi:MAG: Mce-associated rane protein [Mycobacterium sp.]|nr:Mce-associated rane protein [Mycobacterium sp.]
MEGDAGASRLNPPPMPTNRRLRRRNRTFKPNSSQESESVADETAAPAPEATAEDSQESVVEAEKTTPAVTAEDSQESEVGTETTTPVDEESVESAEEPTDAAVAPEAAAPASGERRPSRLGRGWKVFIAAALVLCAAAISAGGYFALRFHQEAQTIARNDAAALKAAVDCVSATQAPDTNAMSASERKIIDCGTDAFRSQALLYTGMIVQAYQAANVHVQVSDVRAAVERNNPDGSIDILVALRVKVASDQSQNETGYRLRVKMALAEGQYRISKLDQVTK